LSLENEPVARLELKRTPLFVDLAEIFSQLTSA